MDRRSQVTESVAGNGRKQLPSATEIQNWLVSYLAKLLETTPDEIDVKISFNRYGLDSYMAVGLIADLEVWLGCNLSPTVMYNYPNIESLARHLGLTFQKGERYGNSFEM